jgi:hypothetical protein
MKLPKYFQDKILSTTIVQIYIVLFILILSIALVSYFTDIPIEIFTRELAVTVTSEKITPLIDDNHNPFSNRYFILVY